MEICDKCNTKIINNKCSCGVWCESDNAPPLIKLLEKAILEWNKGGGKILSGDHPSGTCFILFKGSHETVKRVRKYIERQQVEGLKDVE